MNGSNRICNPLVKPAPLVIPPPGHTPHQDEVGRVVRRPPKFSGSAMSPRPLRAPARSRQSSEEKFSAPVRLRGGLANCWSIIDGDEFFVTAWWTLNRVAVSYRYRMGIAAVTSNRDLLRFAALNNAPEPGVGGVVIIFMGYLLLMAGACAPPACPTAGAGMSVLIMLDRPTALRRALAYRGR